VIGIDEAQNSQTVQAWADNLNLTYLFLLDINSVVSQEFGVTAIPFNVLIDAGGVLRYQSIGYLESALIAAIEANLPGGERHSLYVPREYTSIQAAINAATDGDQIIVAPGQYDLSTTILNQRVNNLLLLGSRREDNRDASIINAAVNPGTYVAIRLQGVKNCEISGFEVKNAHSGIALDNCQNCRITQNYIHHNDQANSWHGNGIEVLNSRQIGIAYCVIDSNEFHGIYLENADSITIDHNTILKTYRNDGLALGNQCNHITVNNNIFGWNREEGIETVWCHPEVFEHDYNCFWQNGGTSPIRDYPLGPHSFIADPQFVNPSSGNYFLQITSPCFKSGEANSHIGALGLNPVPFTRITTGELVNETAQYKGHCWGDFDGDDDPDLFIAVLGGKNRLFKNQGKGIFIKIVDANEPIVNDDAYSLAGSWGDYDNDADLDLFVTNWGRANFLYQNTGNGTFSRILDANNPVVSDVAHSTGCCWFDYDNDGWLDLFVTNYEETNALYHNQGDGSFVRIPEGILVTDPGFGESCAPADYDHDGCVDLFVANRAGTNALYHNLGDGTFEKITTGDIATDNANFIAGSWGDYDNDGFPDLYVIKESYALLYHNHGDGTFTKINDPENPLISETVGGNDACWGDFDNDGDSDLFVTNYLRGWFENNRLYQNNGDATFTRVTDSRNPLLESGRFCTSANWVDYNNDGFLDLFATMNPCLLYQNNGSLGNWIQVKCIGTVSNAAAIGAKVWVNARIQGKSVWQMQEIASQNGHCRQKNLFAEFGLGDADVIDSIKVEWPSGTVDIRTNQSANQLLTIVESTLSVNDAFREDQYQPAIAVAEEISIIVWVDERLRESNIFAQRYNAIGEKLGRNFIVNEQSWPLSETTPDLVDVALATDGSFVIVWENPKFGQIFVQRYDALAQPIGKNLLVDAGSQPAIDMAPNGLFVVVFRSGYPVCGKRFLSLQDTSGARFDVSHIMEYHRHPDVAVSADGAFVITWEAEVSMGVKRIYAQRYDNQGQEIGANFRVDTDPGRYPKATPAIAIAPDGAFVIVWQDERESGVGILGQCYDQNGAPVGTNFIITDGDAACQFRAPVIAFGRQRWGVVAWEDNRQGTAGIYGQCISLEGIRFGKNFRISPELTSVDQAAPDVALHGATAYLTWQENRIPGQGWDIFQTMVTTGNRRIEVPAHFATIQAAITAASDGDSIFVAPGTYPISGSILNERVNYLYLRGSRLEDGSRASTIYPSENTGAFDCLVFRNITGGQISGFEISQGLSAVLLENCHNSEISDCYIHNNDKKSEFHGNGVVISGSQHIEITNCILDSNEFHGILMDSSHSLNIVHNSILRSRHGIAVSDNSSNITIKNNIIALSTEEGIETSGTAPLNFVHDYNCFWLNRLGAIKGLQIGPHSFEADPLWVDIDQENYYLQPGSPCLRTGENGACIGALGQSMTRVADGNSEVPKVFGLSQNFPNPFNPLTDIHFQLPHRSNVTLIIYDILGQEIRVLLDRQERSAGNYSVRWDGKNNQDQPVGSGIYFYRIFAEPFSCTRKMVLIR
jgi:parallel beta-helix repeat protein